MIVLVAVSTAKPAFQSVLNEIITGHYPSRNLHFVVKTFSSNLSKQPSWVSIINLAVAESSSDER